ncbi:hypothetical protein D4764_10G0009050 [Takifugu flavidus]|uniref:Uncharacterized protein n=1 Tax=Takifugu flavidus TaxID=433684 RepID=A0A5C6PKC4_9TELE|nr:hypothetical protein D4764_10G0009050 [Takifugu flavidus]
MPGLLLQGARPGVGHLVTLSLPQFGLWNSPSRLQGGLSLGQKLKSESRYTVGVLHEYRARDPLLRAIRSTGEEAWFTLPIVGGEVLPQREKFKYLGVLFSIGKKMKFEIDRPIVHPLHRVKSSVTWEELRIESLCLPVERSQLRRFKHLFWIPLDISLGKCSRHRVKSSVTWEELRIESLCLPVERSQLRRFKHLFWIPLDISLGKCSSSR